jgi:hypothetical protein
MRSVIRISVVIITGVALAAGGVLAQEAPPQQASKPGVATSVEQKRELELKVQKALRDVIEAKQRAIVELETQKALDQVKVFAATSGMLGGVVTGAPYSATTINESIQTLADGNRIIQRSTFNVSRDGQGRVRREEIGEDDTIVSVMILDPVAGTSYVLDPVKRTARKMPLLINTQVKVMAAGIGAVQVRTFQEQGTQQAGDLKPKTVQGGAIAYWDGVNVSKVERLEARKESLGTQSIEGVPAEGSRTISTIPAGQIGNERPIEIVSEQWYSRELQMTMSSRHADPRTGETTYRVTNLRREEPDPTLFQLPPDYTLQQVLEVKTEKIK